MCSIVRGACSVSPSPPPLFFFKLFNCIINTYYYNMLKVIRTFHSNVLWITPLRSHEDGFGLQLTCIHESFGKYLVSDPACLINLLNIRTMLCWEEKTLQKQPTVYILILILLVCSFKSNFKSPKNGKLKIHKL